MLRASGSNTEHTSSDASSDFSFNSSINRDIVNYPSGNCSADSV